MPIDLSAMIWFAQDSSDRILYEIRRNDERGGFELHLIYSNGRRTIELFQDSSDLVQGARKVQNELRVRLAHTPQLTSSSMSYLGDSGWNPTGGCATNPNQGDVSFAEFGQLISSPLISALVGHPSWRNEPSHLLASQGGRVRVTNRGGRAHTLTEVENFGGGSVAAFNISMTKAPECPPAPNQVQDALAPGQSVTLTNLDSGLYRFQCCFHPWMRATIRVN